MSNLVHKKMLVGMNEKMDAWMVGWKFARQKEMYDKKLPVPKFFCLTSVFFLDVFEPLRQEVKKILEQVDFDDIDSIKTASDCIKNIFKNIEFEERQEALIYGYFDKHFSEDTLVSVRSSTIGFNLSESEDSSDNPFAGISDSFLYVKRHQIIEKIKMCFASGFNVEGLVYRNKQNFNLLGFGVAVGIQQMVFGEKSFVMFTCDPNTASKDMILVAGYGIGEGVVQEKVPVDHYFKSHNNENIKKEIANKNIYLTFDDSKGYDLCTKKTPTKLQRVAVLSDDEINKILQYGDQIEKLFGVPQDIEGTLTSNGEIHILQSRPIALDYRRQRVWTNTNVTESFPGVTTALTYSFARYFYRVIFYDCYRMFGVSKRILHDNFQYLDKMVGFLKGRIYYNLTSFYHLHSLHPLFSLFKGPWEKMMSFLSSYQTKEHKRINIIRRIFGIIKSGVIAGFRVITHQRRMKKFHRWWDKLINPLRGKSFDNEDQIALIAIFNDIWTQVGNYWGVTLSNDTYLPVAYNIIEKKFKKWGLDKHESLLSDLLCGDEKILSVEIVLSVIRLAEQVRGNEVLFKEFKSKSSNELWEDIKLGKYGHNFKDDILKHINDFGDRGLQELKIEQPNIRHTPWILIKMIQDYSKTGITAKEMQDKEKIIRDNAEKILSKSLGIHWIRRFTIRRLLNYLRKLIRNRENSRYCRSELYGVSKNIFYALGHQFAKSKVIRAKEDIVHLTMDEIFGYIDGTGTDENLKEIIKLRKKEYEEYMKVETPEQITTLGPVRNSTLTSKIQQEFNSNVLQGLGSSSGKVIGTAKVILDPNEQIQLTEDMILVAKETDPGWIFLMLSSKGIVVERGSMLSHTAITGRKFGIPTVVSVHKATSIIKDGDKIEIDGAQGTVTIL